MTVPLDVAIEREKQGLIPVPDRNDKGDKLLFWLSPNDWCICQLKKNGSWVG